MGLFDEIRWDAVLPKGHPPDSRLFQTKSLDYPCLDHYVVTPEGRLLLVGNGFEDGADLADAEISSGGIDVEFNGDMRLLSAEGRGNISCVSRTARACVQGRERRCRPHQSDGDYIEVLRVA